MDFYFVDGDLPLACYKRSTMSKILTRFCCYVTGIEDSGMDNRETKVLLLLLLVIILILVLLI